MHPSMRAVLSRDYGERGTAVSGWPEGRAGVRPIAA